MLVSFRAAASLAVTTLVFVATACGEASFTRDDNRSANGAVTGQSSGELGAHADDDDCYGLTGTHPGQAPGQYPGQYPKHPGQTPPPKGPIGKEPYPKKPIVVDEDIVVKKPCAPKKPLPCGKKVCEPAPCKQVGQHGCAPAPKPCGKVGQYDCDDDYYKPIDTDPSFGGKKWPSQKPIVWDHCGKSGKYCDDGGPGQWPGQTIRGGKYNRHDVESCLAAFRRAGYDTRGMWGIDVKAIKNVSVLSDDVIEDHGYEHTIVIIKSVNVLGVMRYRFLNPNALYCVKDVSVLQDIRLTSCHQANVVFGNSVNVLSGIDARVVDCH